MLFASCRGGQVVAAHEAPVETAESWPQPFLVAKTLQYCLKAVGTLVFARLNVSILLHPKLHCWDLHTSLERFHGVQEVALSFPVAGPQAGQSQQSPTPSDHLTAEPACLSYGCRNMAQPSCWA